MTTDRLKDALDSLFRLMLPRLACYCMWEGRVVLSTPAVPSQAFMTAGYEGPASYDRAATVNVAFTDPDALAVFGPEFSNAPIPIYPGVDGFVSSPTIGSLVLVGFINGSPQRPYVAAVDPTFGPSAGVGAILRSALPAAASTIGQFG
jgi:hypothetical protein